MMIYSFESVGVVQEDEEEEDVSGVSGNVHIAVVPVWILTV